MKFIALLLSVCAYVFYVTLFRNLAGLNNLEDHSIADEVYHFVVIFGACIVSWALTKLTISYFLKAIVGKYE